MGITTGLCDRCEVTITGREIHHDYDGIIYCKKCYYEVELGYLTQQLNDKKEWLRDTHLRELADLKKQIRDIKSKL